MIYAFRLPDLGEGITEGDVVKWHVKAGDNIREHQTILDVETDKAIVEVPSPHGGRVVRLVKGEGETAQVGETLIEIEIEADNVTAPDQRGKEASASVVGTLPQVESVFAVPKARALATKLGVDLKSITGTGSGGVITEADVINAKALPSVAEAAAVDRYGTVERVAIKGVRKAISKNLLTSLGNAASVTGMDEADVTDLWHLREREVRVAGEGGVKLTFMPFFMKAVQHSLVKHPMFNASVDEQTGEVIVKKYYNFGVAVNTDDGLIVPVVKGVDKKSILVLASELQALSKKARERKTSLEELKGSSFTITNYGAYGGLFATPIINYPDVAILGTGRIAERPWVKDGEIVIRRILPLSLTFDHRVIDGSEAAVFLARIIKYLEDPANIFIESV